MYKNLDAAILIACTKFSHALQRTLGLTCYFVAKIGVALTAVSVMLDVINYFFPFLAFKTSAILLCVSGLMFMIMVGQSICLAKAEDRLWSGDGVKPAELMPYVRSGTWRVFLVHLFVLNILWFWTGPPFHYWLCEFAERIFFPLGLVVFYYFVAVDPLPPGKSKIRSLIEKLGTIKTPVPVES